MNPRPVLVAVLAAAAIAFAAPASAGSYGALPRAHVGPHWIPGPPLPVRPIHHPHVRHWHGHRDGWIPGLIVGGALAYTLTRPVVVAAPAPVVLAPPAPVAYIERPVPLPAPAAFAAPPIWWYWCPDAHGYYPHVPACPTGWQRVPAQPM